MLVKGLCRNDGFSDATFYKRRIKFGAMDASDAKWLKGLKDEDAKFKIQSTTSKYGIHE